MFPKICVFVFTTILILNQIADTFVTDQDSISSVNIADYYKYSSHFSRRHRRQNINTGCEIPNYPPNAVYEIINEPESTYKPGDIVKKYSILGIICSKGYKLPSFAVKNSICLDGQWDNLSRQTCLRVCPSLMTTTSMTVNCRYNGTILLDNCINPIEGTTAVLMCNSFYESDAIQRNPTRRCINGKWSSSLPECYAICGLKSPKGVLNVIGGANSTPGDHPWQAVIYTSAKNFICGGSIIDQSIILSAAHCFADYDGNKFPPEEYLIATGKYYSQYEDYRDNFAQYSTVREIFIPERFKGINGLNGFDIAVVILKDPLTLTQRVQPVCIDLSENSRNTNYLINNNNGTVTGWGYTQEGKLLSKVLKELQVPLISYEQCYKEVPTNFHKYLTPPDKLCAGHLNQGTSVCQGDSGGGLVYKINTHHYVKGIVSNSPVTTESGTAQCDSQQYGLYTSVAYHVDFIRDLVSIYGWKQSIECTKDICTNEETRNQETCRLPNLPQYGKYSLSERNSKYEPGSYVYLGQLILLTCDVGYEETPLGVTEFYCQAKSQWIPAVGTCNLKQYGTTPRYEDYFPSTPNTVAPAPHKETLNEKFLAGNVNFTAAVYHQQVLRQNSENFIMCPIAAQLVLALTQCGAKSNTASQLASNLHVPSNQIELLQIVSEVIPHLQGNRQTSIHVANKIYAKNNFQFNDDFKTVAVDYFKSEVEAIDFLNPQAAYVMNRWAYQKTNGKIYHLIDASVLDNRTALVLLNTIYFQGKWVYYFDDYFAKDRDFHLNKYHSVKVKTMQMTALLNYHESEELKARFVELPYEGVNITMTIVLPNEIEGLTEVERNLEKVLKHQTYTMEDVHVRLPKFNVTSTVDFADILKSLGVTEAFDDKKADFTRISKFSQRLKIDQVIQKAVLEIDEMGTDPNSTTFTIAANPLSAEIFIPPPLPKLYEVNHPFLYYIKSPAGILLVGRYLK